MSSDEAPLSSASCVEKEVASSDEEHRDLEDQEKAILNQLSNVPFEDLLRIQQNFGKKKWSELNKGGFNELRNFNGKDHNGSQKILKRENKNRPTEMTSRRAVSRYREAIHVPKVASRDPRFDSLCGKLDEDLFKKSYSFVDDIRKNEMRSLKKALTKVKNPQDAEDIKKAVQKLQSQEAAKKEDELRKEAKREWRKQETENVKQGKKPYFLKRSDEKKLYLLKKYEKAKDSNKNVEKVLEKRRKRNANKEHKNLPFKRRRSSEMGDV